MTKEQFAAMLNGREYGNEFTNDEERLATDNGLVIVYGASDDLMEFRGVITDELGVSDGGTAYLDAKGLLPERDQINEDDDDALLEYLTRKKSKSLREINAEWCIEKGYSWTYRTDIPHATFEIMEDGEHYCRGIVFEMAALA